MAEERKPDPFDPGPNAPPRRIPGWLFVVVPIGLVLSLIVGFYGVRPRLIIGAFDRFVERHGAGTSIDAVASDPFVDRATFVMLLEEHPVLPDGVRGTRREEVLALLRTHPSGKLDIMWTHTPPFGRVSATFHYDQGRILDVKKGSLD